MSRFSLRNQKKIEEVFGKPFLENLLKSLKNEFQTNETIQEYETSEKYKIIHVPSQNNGKTIMFYVVSKRYDVLNLAYKPD